MPEEEDLIKKLKKRINVQQTMAKDYEEEAEMMVEMARKVKKKDDDEI